MALGVSCPQPLFVTGVARSGTTLLCRVLDAHPAVSVASDALFPAYRLFRNAILPEIDPKSALSDHYFSDERIRRMDRILEAELDMPLIPAWRPALTNELADRQRRESHDLVSHAPRMLGETYHEVFERTCGVIGEVRAKPGLRWAGAKDVWIIDFFPALARAFEDARFIVIHRDPRAVIASMLQTGAKDPTQYGHPLSYARHWRKTVALCAAFEESFFRERVLFLRYEDFVKAPGREAERLCAFLEIPFDPAILESKRFRDYATGAEWEPNTSGETFHGISAAPIESWRSSLPPKTRQMVESVCGPDMPLAGYGAEDRMPNVSEFSESEPPCFSWRSDFEDPVREVAFERRRRELLGGAPVADDNEIRRNFLFTTVYEKLRTLKSGVEVGQA